jgi:hypothetical protein
MSDETEQGPEEQGTAELRFEALGLNLMAWISPHDGYWGLGILNDPSTVSGPFEKREDALAFLVGELACLLVAVKGVLKKDLGLEELPHAVIELAEPQDVCLLPNDKPPTEIRLGRRLVLEILDRERDTLNGRLLEIAAEEKRQLPRDHGNRGGLMGERTGIEAGLRALALLSQALHPDPRARVPQEAQPGDQGPAPDET